MRLKKKAVVAAKQPSTTAPAQRVSLSSSQPVSREEHTEEPFKAIIHRLDAAALERVLQLAGE